MAESFGRGRLRVREGVLGDHEGTVMSDSELVPFPSHSVETPRLVLRVPELADAQALMGIIWDPEVVEQKQVTLREPPGGLDLALKNTNDMRRQWELRGYGQWSVTEKVTGHV